MPYHGLKWKMVFSTFVHSHGPPHVTFSFFSDRKRWMEYSFTRLRWEIGSFFIFFHFFLLIFAQFLEKRFFGHFRPFYASVWTDGQHLWPITVASHPLSTTHLWMTLPIKKINDFYIFFWKMTFWPFLASWPPEDPLWRARLRNWGLWEAFWGYQAPLLTQYCQQNCSIIYFSCQEPILVHAIVPPCHGFL